MSFDRTIQFIDAHQPPLQAGSYTLDIRHEFKIADAPYQFNRAYKFDVGGDRFAIQPALTRNVFPPRNTLGDYDAVLPHVVLTRRTLPWERTLFRFGEAQSMAQGAPTWLALLVFGEQDAPRVIKGKLSDLYPGTTADGNDPSTPKQEDVGALPHATLSYGTPAGTSATKSTFLEPNESGGDPCLWMEISARRFSEYAPSLADLSWTAHARVRDYGDGEPRDHAVVVANRLPPAGQTAVAHLVSLEGMGPYLPDANGNPSQEMTSSGCTVVRLVSLVSWSFRVAPLRASFSALILALNQGGKEESLLRLPVRKSQIAMIGTALDAGYTVLTHEAGDTAAASWYRGPLIPGTTDAAAVAAAAAIVPADAASDFTMDGTGTGLHDNSLAAAWEIGRLLALADTAFATAQVRWKRDSRLNLNLKFQLSANAIGSRAERARNFSALLKSPSQIQSLIGTGLALPGQASGTGLPIAKSLVSGMGRFALLEGVPYCYLVPDARMLPPESIRFFNVDARWLTALLDGAWSLGREPREDWALDSAYTPALLSMLPKPVSGVVLNSRLVSAYWPGIAFEPKGKTPVKVLRLDRLGPDTVLALFDGALDGLTISEPPEGMHFGFELAADGTVEKPLRYVTIDKKIYPAASYAGADCRSGCSVYTDSTNKVFVEASAPMRSWGVVRMDALATALQNKLGITGGGPGFTVAEFAQELVEGVEAVEFTPEAGAQ